VYAELEVLGFPVLVGEWTSRGRASGRPGGGVIRRNRSSIYFIVFELLEVMEK